MLLPSCKIQILNFAHLSICIDSVYRSIWGWPKITLTENYKIIGNRNIDCGRTTSGAEQCKNCDEQQCAKKELSTTANREIKA